MNLKGKRIIPVCFIALCVSTVIVYGQSPANNPSPNDAIESQITTSQFQTTETLQSQAKHWNLSVEEYSTYLELMRGPLGKWNPKIDPLLALGMYAETPQQERYYAERYAQQEFELTQRALHFQLTYRAAFNRLYPNTDVLDAKLLQPYFASRQLKQASRQTINLEHRSFNARDTLLYFVDLNCDDCGRVINRLVTLLSGLDQAKIKIYILGTVSDTQIQQWAQTQSINADWLKDGLLSLNRDEGLYQQLASRSPSQSPNNLKLFLNRAEHYYQLSTSDIGL